MTLGQLTTRTRLRLDEGTEAVAYTDASVLAALNEGQRLFALLTLSIERTIPFLLEPAANFQRILPQLPDWIVPLRATQRALPVSGGALFDAPLFDEVLFDEPAAARGNPRRIKPATLAELAALDASWPGAAASDTTLRYGTLGNDLLFVSPAPVTFGVDIDFTYAAAPAVLAGDDDVPEIPVKYHPALMDFAIPTLRFNDGGKELTRVAELFSRFLMAAKECAEKQRTRSRQLGYDFEPVELKEYDRSREQKKRAVA